MKSVHFLVLLVFGTFCAFRGGIVPVCAEQWNYTDQNAWKTVPGWYCYGARQSPINIRNSDMVIYRDLIDLKLWNFDQSYNGTFSNNGHTVRFDPAAGSPAVLFENHLGTYELQQFHFHWGDNSEKGSEHTINGEYSSGELHFVFKKTSGISTTGDAYAVLGVFLIESIWEPMPNSLGELYINMPVGNNDANSVHGVRLTDFLPSSLDYYHYEGSLTTPPCSEVVQWFVIRELLYMQSSFFVKLRSIQSSSGGSLTKNYRYLQPINGRQVMIQPNCNGDDSDNDQL